MKIRIGVFRFFMGIAVLVGLVFPGALCGEERIYTVQKGETFYSIARSLGVKADDLMKYNGISDPSRLQAGQRIKIPVPAGQSGNTEAASGGLISYRVIRGDTLYGIARKYSTTVDAIREANKLSGNYVLKEGDSLSLPAGGNLPAGGRLPAAAVNPAAGGNTAPAGSISGEGKIPGVPPAAPGPVAVDPSVNWPVKAHEISYMTGKLSGVVITGTRAEQVKCLTWGTVLSAGPYRGFGKVVIIQVEGGYLYVYGGCESLSVKEGDKVGPGTELGILGIDAVSNKPQLFFMVYRSNAPMDPARAPRA